MDTAPVARLYLDQVIAPNRSLPKSGFAVLIGVVIAANLVLGILFVAIGAGPIPIFLCLGVLAVVLAFRVSYAQARAQERVQVSADSVRVVRYTRAGAQEVWNSPTAFTRVDLMRGGRYGSEVRLRLSGRRLTIALSLGPREREDLADALERAILEARAERHQP